MTSADKGILHRFKLGTDFSNPKALKNFGPVSHENQLKDLEEER